jgi:hypothetical protein
MAYYGTINGANTYFANRLHSDAWSDSAVTDRPIALTESTRIIDSLNYRGLKHSVWLIMYEPDPYNTGNYTKVLVNPPSRQDLIDADATQELEFPRGQDTTVPTQIEYACYEIALELLDGFDPEDAVERQNVIRQAYSAVRTTYDNSSSALEYLGYGIPTARVWRMLKPYLTDSRMINFSRAD